MVHDTPSHGSDHLCLIWKESIPNCRWYRADTACETDGQTDGRTEWNQYTPPTTSLCGGYKNYTFLLLIEAWWCIYASVNWVIMDSVNGLAPKRWTHDYLSIVPLRTNFSKISTKRIFFEENTHGNSVILFRPHCIKVASLCKKEEALMKHHCNVSHFFWRVLWLISTELQVTHRFKNHSGS